MGSAESAVRTFAVPLPPEWGAARGLALEFRALKVPANRTGELEVTCIDSKGGSRPVASLPFIALSREAAGVVERASVVVALPPVSQWIGNVDASAPKVHLRVRPVDGQGREIEDLAWDVRELALKAR